MKPSTKPRKYADTDYNASSKNEMLAILVDYPGIDPYRAASGIVRLHAIDRWLNELQDEGYIIGWEDNGKTWCDVTAKGLKLVKARA